LIDGQLPSAKASGLVTAVKRGATCMICKKRLCTWEIHSIDLAQDLTKWLGEFVDENIEALQHKLKGCSELKVATISIVDFVGGMTDR
jgi:hypothetical protein